MPYSTACATPLSNFEANQNYKDVSDPAIYVSYVSCTGLLVCADVQPLIHTHART